MTVIERNTPASTTNEYLVHPLRDRAEIRSILEDRRPYAAYVLGQLEPVLFRQTNWWLSSSATNQALVLHSRGGLGNNIWQVEPFQDLPPEALEAAGQVFDRHTQNQPRVNRAAATDERAQERPVASSAASDPT